MALQGSCPKEPVFHPGGRREPGAGQKPRPRGAQELLDQDWTHVVEDVGPALHGDALEHSQHGEGEVVEIGDAVLGPIPAWFAHCAVLALPPVARLQGTG